MSILEYRPLTDVTGKDYLSYSSLSSWLECGERFRLERIVKVPQGEAWWFVGGTAFHTACELVTTSDIDPAEAWAKVWEDAYQGVLERVGGDLSLVRAGGRASKQWPDRENHEWWEVNGKGMVFDYAVWLLRKRDEGWSVLDIDGKPAVEVPVERDLGDAHVKGFIDLVLVNPSGEVVVIDLKTSQRIPASTLQLGVYRLGLAEKYGVTPNLGAYYMGRTGQLSNMFSLLHYDERFVGSQFTKAKFAIENGVFIPHVTSMCATCSVNKWCVAVGGIDPDSVRFGPESNTAQGV